MTRKKIFNYVARSAMTLFLAVAGITNASAKVDFLGHSAINVNGTWYYTDDENHSWCTGGNFNGANLGTFANTLRLSGQSQTWESGNVNWNSGTVTMYYKIDNGDVESIGLNYFKFANNNNYFQYGGSNFAFHPIDISGLSVNEQHTISVWFNCGDKWDSNNSANYVATFNVTDKVSYTDENGDPQSHEAKSISDNTITTLNEEWYVVDRDITFDHTLELNGNVNIILADGCTMNVGTEDSPITLGNGILASSSTDGTLTIYGQSEKTGILNIFDDEEYGIQTYSTNNECSYDIIINGGNINVTSAGSGIEMGGDFTINGGNISASGAGAGISAHNIDMNGGSINATGNFGIKADSKLTIKGGEVRATANSDYYAIYTSENITINGGIINASAPNEGTCIHTSDITIKGGTVAVNTDNAWYGITADNIVIEDGTVTVKKDDEEAYDADYAIYAYYTINITGGTVVANGCYCGIYSEEGDITIEGGDVTATIIASGDSYGAIYAVDGDINISDGIVNASGGDASIYAYNGDVTISGGEVIVSSDYYGIYTYESGNIIINGGKVTANCTYSGIRGNSPYSVITINGGNITATATGSNTGSENNHFAIGAKSIAINGGEVTVYGTNSDGIYTPNITLNGGIVNATGGNNGINIKGDGSIVLNGAVVKATSYNGTVTVGSGFSYTDEENGSYTGVISDNDVLANKILEPSGYTLTANQPTDEDYAGTYWTTLYFRSLGFKINNNVNACAYTATYDSDNSEITLDKLGEDGKSIPQNTAVIIVSSTPSVSMTADGTLGTFTGSNDLHGVDVSTPTADIISDLGSGTFYVMGQTSGAEGGFGFHKYIGTTMPARKAFLLIDGDGAALARMVFNDATGIKSIDNGLRTIDNESDAWYSLDGRMLSQKPTTKGVYINNGKKIVIK